MSGHCRTSPSMDARCTCSSAPRRAASSRKRSLDLVEAPGREAGTTRTSTSWAAASTPQGKTTPVIPVALINSRSTARTSPNRSVMANQGAGSWNVSPTLDSVQEVNVMTDTYDARYGRTTGGTVNVVTKNGTNSFHGELVENYKDGSLFDANTTTNVFIAGLPTQQQVENQFGGTIGGPILKNKVWFFASFEGYRQSIKNTVTGSVPPAYLRPGFNGNPGVDFGLVQTMDPGYTSQGAQADPYVLYGLTLFQPGDSTNSSNPNNAICSPTFSTGGPPSTCGSNTNLVQNVFPFTGGTGNGALIPAAMINNTANLMLKAGYISLPNVGGAENYVGGFGEPANYFAVSPDYYSYNQPMFRVDYNTSDKTKWYSFFGWQKGHERRSNNGLTGLLANGNYIERDSYTASQDMTHTFSQTLLG